MDKDDKYIRKVQTAVNIFLQFGDEYLFLQRNLNKRIDPGKLNAIGGRVEPEEDFLAAAIRETEEETGYKLSSNKLNFCGVVKLEGGYAEDWVLCLFKASVDTKDIPAGNETSDGKLIWIHKDSVLDSSYELIDDLRYYLKDLIEGKCIFFMNSVMNSEEKVERLSLSKIDLNS